MLIQSGTLPILYPTKSHAIDLTNQQFNKVVYLGNNAAPITYTVSNGCAYIPNFTFVPGYNIWIWNRYDDVTTTTTFTNRYISASYVPISLSELNGSTTISPAKKQAYNWQYETKLYASEFYQPTAVLDGNTTAIYQLEKILPSYSEDVSLKITKYASVNMDDDVCYKSALATGGVLIKNSPTSDIMAGQLQEVPLQTSSYLEYIRNGFNYDSQQYKIQERNNKIGIAMQVMQSAAQIGLGVAGIGGTYLTALQTKNALVQQATQRVQGINEQISTNLSNFKSHRSRARTKLPSGYTKDEWNAEQRRYYAD